MGGWGKWVTLGKSKISIQGTFLIGAYIILGAVNLLVICLAFHIITINSTNPLQILQLFFLFRSTTVELTSWDLSMCIFIGFVSCSFEDISLDKVIPAIDFYHINIPGWFLTYFPTTDYGFDYPNDLCVQNAFFNAY